MVTVNVLAMNADHLGLVPRLGESKHHIMNKHAKIDGGWFKHKSIFRQLLQ
jgi:hypothetical protein